MNSRLDTIQAAILLEKLHVFPEEIVLREGIARRYSTILGRSNRIRVPTVMPGVQSTWAQYTIQVPERDRLQAELMTNGIPTAIFVPEMHLCSTIQRSFLRAFEGAGSGAAAPSRRSSSFCIDASTTACFGPFRVRRENSRTGIDCAWEHLSTRRLSRKAKAGK